MARISLSNGFSLIPEGTYVFKIEKVTYDEEFGKMEVGMVTSSGLRHTERFSLLDAGGNVNEGALNAFSFFAKTALNDFTVSDIDEQDLVGCFIRAEVTHSQQQSRRTGKMMTFANLGEKSPADASEFGGANGAEPAKESEGKIEAPAFSGLMGMLK